MKTRRKIVYWDEKIETLPRDKFAELQLARLKERVGYVLSRSPFYRRKLGDLGIRLESIQDFDDFRRLVPLTRKEELRKEREESRDPYGGLLCVPREEIVHLVRTAGTTGVPSIYGLTPRDVQILGELTARAWYQIGAQKGHTVACATMGTWNYFAKALIEGLRVAGMNVYHFSMPIPGEEVFPIEVLSRWMEIQGFYLSARPFLQITEKYAERLKALLPNLEYILVAGQRMTQSFRRQVESLWGGPLYEAYPITDVGLPSANCTAQIETFHFPEDAFFVEVIDPNTGHDLTGSGKVGEIIVTSLVMEGTPLLRFRTEDMGFAIFEPCPCGRTGMRLGLSERLAHAIRVGHHLIFSSDVEDVLYEFPSFLFRSYYMVRKKQQPQEKLIIRVEGSSGVPPEERLKEKLIARLRQAMQVDAEVEFISKEDERFVVGYKTLKVVTEE